MPHLRYRLIQLALLSGLVFTLPLSTRAAPKCDGWDIECLCWEHCYDLRHTCEINNGTITDDCGWDDFTGCDDHLVCSI
jgi:hypothetical protein